MGESAFIDCIVAGQPVPTVEWRKADDETVTGGEKYVIHDNNTLEITSFTADLDDGSYYCTATNTNGTVRSLSAQLTAACKLTPGSINVITLYIALGTITLDLSSMQFMANTALTLSCDTPTSLPPATVTWYRGNSIVSLDDRVGITLSHQLVLRYTKESDQAVWKCVVSNPLASSQTHDSNQYTLIESMLACA